MTHKQFATLYLSGFALIFLLTVIAVGFGDLIYDTVNPPPVSFAASEVYIPPVVSRTPVQTYSVWNNVRMSTTMGIITTTVIFYILALWKVQAQNEPSPIVQSVRGDVRNRPNNLLIEQSPQIASHEWLADFVARYDN